MSIILKGIISVYYSKHSLCNSHYSIELYSHNPPTTCYIVSLLCLYCFHIFITSSLTYCDNICQNWPSLRKPGLWIRILFAVMSYIAFHCFFLHKKLHQCLTFPSEFLIGFEACAKLAQKRLVYAPLRILRVNAVSDNIIIINCATGPKRELCSAK